MLLKVLAIGQQKNGKTGSLASLLDKGFRIRLADFDGNAIPIYTFSKKENHKNLTVLDCRDQFVGAHGLLEGRNKSDTMPYLKQSVWGYRTLMTALATKKWVDGSDPTQWDENDVFVIDSLTSLTSSYERYVDAQDNAIWKKKNYDFYNKAYAFLISNLIVPISTLNCHFVLISHYSRRQPEEVLQTVNEIEMRDLSSDVARKVHEMIAKRYLEEAENIKAEGVIPIAPSAKIGNILISYFNTVLHFKDRKIYTMPLPENPKVCLPLPGFPREMLLGDLAGIFGAAVKS